MTSRPSGERQAPPYLSRLIWSAYFVFVGFHSCAFFGHPGCGTIVGVSAIAVHGAILVTLAMISCSMFFWLLMCDSCMVRRFVYAAAIGTIGFMMFGGILA